MARIRPFLAASAALVLGLAACGQLAGAPVASAASAGHRCRSSDLRYAFSPGAPKAFGVFRLRVAGGSCTTARRVAHAWMNGFEINIHNGTETLPQLVRGFTFVTLPAHEAQTYRERGTKASTTIRFDYRVPNG